jgi:hypothetical protein
MAIKAVTTVLVRLEVQRASGEELFDVRNAIRAHGVIVHFPPPFDGPFHPFSASHMKT